MKERNKLTEDQLVELRQQHAQQVEALKKQQKSCDVCGQLTSWITDSTWSDLYAEQGSDQTPKLQSNEASTHVLCPRIRELQSFEHNAREGLESLRCDFNRFTHEQQHVHKQRRSIRHRAKWLLRWLEDRI